MASVQALVERISVPQQCELAHQVAQVLAPYGGLALSVIAPDAFASLLDLLDRGPGPEAAEALTEIEVVLTRLPDDEPAGAGFYTFAAVVALAYLGQTLLGDAVGPIHAAKRLVDALGFADDEGQSGLYRKAVEFLEQPSHDAAVALREMVADRARVLTAG